MSRFLLSASLFGIVLGLAPLSAHAQQQYNNPQQNATAYIAPSPTESSPYTGFAQDFIYGSEEEEEEGEGVGAWQYGSKFKGKPGEEEEKKINLLPMGTQSLYFIRKPGMKTNEAVLRMVTPVSVTGCVDVVPPGVSMRRSGNIIAFRIEDPLLALDKTVQYAHFTCDLKSGTASADLTLNRDDMIRDGIKSLSFKSSGGVMDIYNVDLQGDRLELVPKTTTAFRPFRTGAKPDPLSFRFYPDNTIILFAPSAPGGEDLSAEIAALAQSKGLSESTILASGPQHYFVDPAGTLSGSLDFNATAYIGTVQAHETFQGPGGSYQKEKPVAVYAKRPGLLD